MKKKVLVSIIAATMLASVFMAGCGKSKNSETVNEAAKDIADAANEVVEETSEAADAVNEAANEATEATETALDDAANAIGDAAGDLTDVATDLAEEAAEQLEELSPEDHLELIKEHLVFMGGLAISDPENDLMMALFKNDGTPIVIIEKLGNIYYGEFTTEEATLDDGREYNKLFIEDKEFGYHFKLEDGDSDSFLVDEDGKVYDAKESAESAAYDMVLDTLK